jgi:phage gpG-like protein
VSGSYRPGDAKLTLDAVTERLRKAHRASIKRAAPVLQGEIKLALSRPGTGRTYKSWGVTSRLARKGTKKRLKQEHRASSPGEPPAVDTGFLRASVVINYEGDGTARVGPAAKYAAALEYGTMQPLRSVRFRKGPSANRKHLASALRKSSASRALVQSVRQRGSGRLAPRPFMQPARLIAEPKMRDVIVDDLQVAVAQIANGAR